VDHGQLEALGIWSSYHDAFGNHYQLSEDAAAQLLAAMDVVPGEPVPDGRDPGAASAPRGCRPIVENVTEFASNLSSL